MAEETTNQCNVNIEFNAATTGMNMDNTVNKITMMRGWNQPGDIKDEGTNIYVRGLGQD